MCSGVLVCVCVFSVFVFFCVYLCVSMCTSVRVHVTKNYCLPPATFLPVCVCPYIQLYSLDGERVSVHQQCENRLQFTSLRSSDAGVYACLVENKLRSKQVNATLTVTGKPCYGGCSVVGSMH